LEFTPRTAKIQIAHMPLSEGTLMPNEVHQYGFGKQSQVDKRLHAKLGDRCGHRRMPLHFDAMQNKELEVVQFLTEQYLHALQERPDFGYLPLHFAATATATHEASLAVVQHLARQQAPFGTSGQRSGDLPPWTWP
jgi:hypothetical protein